MSHQENDSCAPMTVMFRVKDIKKSIAFYRDTLGFKLKESWPENAPVWASLRLGEQGVMLGQHVDAAQAQAMCGDKPAGAVYVAQAEAFAKGRAGVGVIVYVKVDDVDGFHGNVTKKTKTLTQPTSQFYGLRDFLVEDPDGYQLDFYAPIKLESCQSCGMPLPDAKEGQMYCQYCVDDAGKLKPYEAVLEGCINGYFIPQQKMARPQAEKAAREHLAKMPAWAMRK